MNGFVHMLLDNESPDEMLMVVKEHNLKTVEKMYNGYPVKFCTIKGLDELFEKVTTLLKDGYLYLGFGVHGRNPKYLDLDVSWASCFYKQYGVDPSLRWTKFKYPKNMNGSFELANKIIKEVGPDYIIVHDDPSRGFNLNGKRVLEQMIQDRHDKMPIVYLGKNRYLYPLIEHTLSPVLTFETETLYDYCHLLANARACHMLDSSIALLLDFLPDTRDGQKRYMHEYAKVGEILSTEGLFQKEWVCLKD
jgi:hypothetical protein